jgi:putative DNA primase/helicase
MLRLGKRGGLIGDENNILIALLNAPELCGLVTYDVRANKFVAKVPATLGRVSWVPGPWSDNHTSTLTIWLQSQGLPIKAHQVDRALGALSLENRIDPLEDFLLGLQWDGTERIGHWLTTYAGAADTPITSMIGSKFLISMVARALQPGCQCDHALTLEGGQGAGKTAFVRILGNPYHAEGLPDFHSRDAQQIATSRWIIEIPDLASMDRSSIQQFKAFITTCEDTYVPKWGRHPATFKRWCVFVLTVNPEGEGGWLQDTTGNRRIWPVKVGDDLNLDALRKDRDQLFAEAKECYLRGDKWWAEQSEVHLFEAVQTERLFHDAWEGPIAFHLEEKIGQGDTFFKMVDIARDALKLEPKDLNRPNQLRIANILKKLRCEPGHKRIDGIFTRGWKPCLIR